MNLKQLEYFVHVAELGSYNRAASFLAIAQPALSRQIRHLELELGQSLFIRTGRGVGLTEAGKRLLSRARGILQQMEHVKQELEETKGEPLGHLTIGMPPTLARVLTLPLVSEFRDRFPKAALRFDGLPAAGRCTTPSF